jgi:hypothetical protein
MVNEALAERIYGIKRTAKTNCVCHNKPQSRERFKNELSFKEFSISGLCQYSQDVVFGDDDGFPIED